MHVVTAHVREHRTFGGDYRLLVLEAAAVADHAIPGQFLHLRVPAPDESVLRRPFSIYGAADGAVRVLYKAVGKGTRAMLDVGEGSPLSMIGPLGNGFPMPPPDRPVIGVAGGYGVAPLSFLASRLSDTGTVLIGGRTARDILCVEDFEARDWEVAVTTEDGSLGTQGRVTAVLDERLPPGAPPTTIYACGPEAMLRAVGDRAVANGHTAWLSLDKHMGCGIGACLACVQKIREPDGTVTWKRVCREGPVFEAATVVWE